MFWSYCYTGYLTAQSLAARKFSTVSRDTLATVQGEKRGCHVEEPAGTSNIFIIESNCSRLETCAGGNSYMFVL